MIDSFLNRTAFSTSEAFISIWTVMLMTTSLFRTEIVFFPPIPKPEARVFSPDRMSIDPLRAFNLSFNSLTLSIEAITPEMVFEMPCVSMTPLT